MSRATSSPRRRFSTRKKSSAPRDSARSIFTGRTVFIGRTQGGIDKSSFYIDNLLFTFDGNLIRFGFKNIDATISDAAAVLKFFPAKLFGRVEGDLRYGGGLYNGNLKLNNCGYDPETGLVSDLHASLAIADNRFKQTGIPFKFYGNPCALSIASTDASLSKLFINVGAEKIVIDPEKTRFSQGDAPHQHPQRNQRHHQRQPVPVRPAPGHRHPAPVPPFRHNRRHTGVPVHFRRRHHLRQRRHLHGPGSAPGFAVTELQQYHAAESCGIQSKKSATGFSASANGKSKIDFELSDKILQTARGNVEFTIDRGKLVDTGDPERPGAPVSELKYKLRDLEFNKIYGNMDIKGTTYLVNSFIFNSNNVRLKITGVFNDKLIASPLNITLEFTRNFIQDLPGLITIGLNKYLRGEWYIMPFSMTGDMMNGSNLRRVN